VIDETVGMRGHRSLKHMRYMIEAGYSCVTDEECLKDVIPFGNISQLQNMFAWVHANINLGMPFQCPGWSPPGYWDDSEKSYAEYFGLGLATRESGLLE
jgi:hypothetical protein